MSDPARPVFLTSLAETATLCARCGYCNAVCCTHRELGWESMSPRGWLTMARELSVNPDGPFPEEFVAQVFNCTLCAKCAQVCPVHLDLRGLWLELRESIVRRGQGPAFTKHLREVEAREHNVFDLPNEERAEWVWFMPDTPDDGYLREQAEVLYYVGCVSSFSPAAQEIPKAMVKILEAAGVDFAILGGDEWCCGFPLLAAGQRQEAQAFIAHNIEALHQLGVRTVVFNCPSCYHIWQHDYNLEGIELLHATQFIARLVEEGRLRLGPLPTRVTYHDPCDLGRNSGVYEEPRQVLEAIPELAFVEMLHNWAEAPCCGGGGDFEMLQPELSEAIAARLVQEAELTGAERLIVACPQCKRIELSGVEVLGSTMRVIDIVELVHEAVTSHQGQSQ
ncbi:MAG: (Fe-S)-binding protein [Anaerolineae bacterium]